MILELDKMYLLERCEICGRVVPNYNFRGYLFGTIEQYNRHVNKHMRLFLWLKTASIIHYFYGQSYEIRGNPCVFMCRICSELLI
jgi:hypothetical protein